MRGRMSKQFYTSENEKERRRVCSQRAAVLILANLFQGQRRLVERVPDQLGSAFGHLG